MWPARPARIPRAGGDRRPPPPPPMQPSSRYQTERGGSAARGRGRRAATPSAREGNPAAGGPIAGAHPRAAPAHTTHGRGGGRGRRGVARTRAGGGVEESRESRLRRPCRTPLTCSPGSTQAPASTHKALRPSRPLSTKKRPVPSHESRRGGRTARAARRAAAAARPPAPGGTPEQSSTTRAVAPAARGPAGGRHGGRAARRAVRARAARHVRPIGCVRSAGRPTRARGSTACGRRHGAREPAGRRWRWLRARARARARVSPHPPPGGRSLCRHPHAAFRLQPSIQARADAPQRPQPPPSRACDPRPCLDNPLPCPTLPGPGPGHIGRAGGHGGW